MAPAWPWGSFALPPPHCWPTRSDSAARGHVRATEGGASSCDLHKGTLGARRDRKQL